MTDDDSEGWSTGKKVLVGVVAVGGVGVVLVGLLLVAVIGGFATNFEPSGTSVPQAQFDTGYETTTLTVTHDGGQPIDAADLDVVVSGEDRGTWATLAGDDEITSGDAVEIRDVQESDTVRIIYDGGDVTTPLTSWRGAQA